jgi:hypothetical protein
LSGLVTGVLLLSEPPPSFNRRSLSSLKTSTHRHHTFDITPLYVWQLSQTKPNTKMHNESPPLHPRVQSQLNFIPFSLSLVVVCIYCCDCIVTFPKAVLMCAHEAASHTPVQ